MRKEKGPNPDNECAHLLERKGMFEEGDMLRVMWGKQEKLQQLLGTLVVSDNMQVRMNEITVQWRNLCVEFGEMMQRLPYKEWKRYSKKGDFDALRIGSQERAEVLFEYVDMLHFFINIGICLGLDADHVFRLFMLKNDENRDRKRRGY